MFLVGLLFWIDLTYAARMTVRGGFVLAGFFMALW
jgi:hypothetical protein